MWIRAEERGREAVAHADSLASLGAHVHTVKASNKESSQTLFSSCSLSLILS